MNQGVGIVLALPSLMPFRITEGVRDCARSIELHGWLDDSVVAEFERVANELTLPFCIDATHLVGASAEGVRALTSQEERGATLTGLSPFFELLLRGAVADGDAAGA